MDRETKGGWVYIMTDRYRGTMYVGVTADLPPASKRPCIAHEKALKRWHREWRFKLIKRGNPGLFGVLSLC
jgi:putative endonuclease